MSEFEGKLLIHPLRDILKRVQGLLKSKALSYGEVSFLAKDTTNVAQFIMSLGKGDEIAEMLQSDSITSMTIGESRKGMAEILITTVAPNQEAEESTSIFNKARLFYSFSPL